MSTLVDNTILTFLEEKAKFLLKKLVGGRNQEMNPKIQPQICLTLTNLCALCHPTSPHSFVVWMNLWSPTWACRMQLIFYFDPHPHWQAGYLAMPTATFTLIWGRTRILSPKGGVGEEAEGVMGRVPIQKIIHQVHVTLRNGCPATPDCTWNRGSLVRQGDTAPPLWDFGQGAPCLLCLRERRCLSLFPYCCY